MTRQSLLGGAALAAVASLIAAPALAFEKVEWEWDLEAHTDIDQYIDAKVDIDPSGFVALENLQLQIGDVTAESYVSDIDNNRPHDKKYGWGWSVPKALDAKVELPEVVSSATAVGNASSVKSHVSTNIHEAQVLFATGSLSNSLLGFIAPAEITATSDVWDINNATVDTSATAVGNLKSIELAAATADDAMMVADVTQLSFANVTAYSEVRDVSINGYRNLAGIDRPIASSVATAIGNNLSVTVTSPLGQSLED